MIKFISINFFDHPDSLGRREAFRGRGPRLPCRGLHASRGVRGRMEAEECLVVALARPAPSDQPGHEVLSPVRSQRLECQCRFHPLLGAARSSSRSQSWASSSSRSAEPSAAIRKQTLQGGLKESSAEVLLFGSRVETVGEVECRSAVADHIEDLRRREDTAREVGHLGPVHRLGLECFPQALRGQVRRIELDGQLRRQCNQVPLDPASLKARSA